MDLVRLAKQNAKKLKKWIIYPEAFDERTLKAIEVVVKEKLAKPILLGNPQDIERTIKKLKLKLNPEAIKIVDPTEPRHVKRYAQELYRLRQEKGMTLPEATKLLKDLNYFGAMMLHMHEADGMVTGANCSTSESVRPTLQIIKTKKQFHKVSGVFFMILRNRLLLFADCAINIDPTSQELADIAIDTAETARRFGLKPKIAMLSFSTHGHSDDALTAKVKEATALVRAKAPELIVEGEMQVDAALVPAIAQQKAPKAKIQGDANILIFPNLQAGNIAYKLVERLAGAKAIGPILQGLQMPVNDLSRGCSWEDIVDITAFTACEAAETIYH